MADKRKQGKKRSKSFHRQYAGGKKMRKDRDLDAGMQGILLTCNFNEQRCVREAYNLLNEYADKLYGPEGNKEETEIDDGDGSEEDIAESLQREVAQLNKQRSSKERRFQAVNSGAKNVVFIKTKGVDPNKLVREILTDLEQTRQRKSQHIMRMLPITHTCKTYEEKIEKTAAEMLQSHFHGPDARNSTFCVTFKMRNNSTLKRMNIINLLASMVKRESPHQHEVELDDPDIVILVEVIASICCLSVLSDYHRFKRYNLHAVADGTAGDDASNKGGKRIGDDVKKDVDCEKEKDALEEKEDKKEVQKEEKEEEKGEEKEKDDAKGTGADVKNNVYVVNTQPPSIEPTHDEQISQPTQVICSESCAKETACTPVVDCQKDTVQSENVSSDKEFNYAAAHETPGADDSNKCDKRTSDA